MAMAPSAPRFAYLPISTPSAAIANLRRLDSATSQGTGPLYPGGEVGSSRKPAGEAQSLEGDGEGGEYSFANLGGTLGRLGVQQSSLGAESSSFEASRQ